MTFFDDDQTAEALEGALDDVVEGEAEVFDEPVGTAVATAPEQPAAAITLDAAVMEYFAWEEEREAKRSRRKGSNASSAKRGAFVLD